MEGLAEFLETIRSRHLHLGYFRALLHICVGRKIMRADGTLLSSGVTWRQLAELLKNIRWDKESVRELGLNPDDLPPRDRYRYWYTAIGAAGIDSHACKQEAETFAQVLLLNGFTIN
ncbi:MAG: hypothetical protein R3B84_00845 [Zavarzinella sp.]